MLDKLLSSLGVIFSLNSYLSRHFVLDVLLRFIQVLSWFDQWINQTLCVGYSSSSFEVHLVIEQWFKKKPCVWYFTKMHLFFFAIWPVNKADTMYEIIYWVRLDWIWSLNSYLIRHSVLDILLRFICFFQFFEKWINQTLCVS